MSLVRRFLYLILFIALNLLSACDQLFSSLHKDWGDTSKGLNPEKVELVLDDLKQEKISYLISESPGLGRWLVNRLQDVNIDGKDEKNDHRLLEARLAGQLQQMAIWNEQPSLYRDSYAKSQWMSELQQLCATWANHGKLQNWKLAPMEARMLAQVLFSSTVSSQTPDSACISAQQLQENYQDIVNLEAAQPHLRAALLQILWINQSSSGVAQAIQKLDSLSPKLNSSGDLIRLVGHPDFEVASTSAKLIAELTPPNAMYALRFHLVKATSDDLKVEILKAMRAYGVQTRAYHEQLKQLLQLTDSKVVQDAIWDVLKITGSH